MLGLKEINTVAHLLEDVVVSIKKKELLFNKKIADLILDFKDLLVFFIANYEKDKQFHIGNIRQQSFKDIWKSHRYKEVMNLLASERFDSKKQCTCLCLQHHGNEFLWNLKQGNILLNDIKAEPKPIHTNFIFDKQWHESCISIPAGIFCGCR